MTEPVSPQTPELDRLAAIHDDRTVISDFIYWLGTQGIHMMRWVKSDDDEGWVPVGRDAEQLIADYYEIDLKKVEKERRAILAHVRATQITDPDTGPDETWLAKRQANLLAGPSREVNP